MYRVREPSAACRACGEPLSHRRLSAPAAATGWGSWLPVYCCYKVKPTANEQVRR